MMDDFVDQDWFEESAEDEAVKQHPMPGVEQQPPSSPLHNPLENGFGCFHSAPIHGQSDFLELNVPVDEMFFGTAEMTTPQLTELDANSQQQQKINNCLSSNAKIVQEVQPKAFHCHMEDHQLGSQMQIGTLGGGMGTVQQNGHEMQQREPFYADWPPTTSSGFTTTDQPMANTVKMDKQNGRDEQQQRHTQQQHGWTTPFGELKGNGQSQYEQQQNEYGGAQPTKLSGTNGGTFPMARIIVHDQSAVQFSQQSFGSDSIELHQNGLFHNNYASPCNAQNNQNVQRLFGQQQQIVIAEEPIHQRNFLQRTQNVAEFRPAQNPSKLTNKRSSKAKSSVNNNQKSTAFEPGHAQSSSGPNLDQVAARLFSNSNLATVQFDAQRAVEFAQVMEQTKLLREQEEQGADVHTQLRACEARIAELVQNAMALQGNGATTAQGTTAKKKSKAKKKAPPKTEQQQLNDVQRTNGIAQPTEVNAFPLSNGSGPIVSTCLQTVVPLPSHGIICQPRTENAINLGSVDSDESKQYSVLPAFPPASCSSFPNKFPPSAPSHPNSVSKNAASSLPNFPKPSPSVSSADATHLQQKSSLNEEFRLQKWHNKKEEKSEAQKAEERERERLRKEEERERRRTKLADAFSVLRASVPTLDYKTPFADKMDCVKRLLPFGLFAETELSDDFLQKFDGELQRHSEFLCERLESLKERFQSVFITESLSDMKEQNSLLLRLDVEFEKAQLQKAAEANGTAFSFPNTSSSSNLLEWEYDDGWDRNRYKNISPFASPSNSPKNDVEFGGQIKDGTTDDEEFAQKEEEQIEETEEHDEAAAQSAKIGTIRLTLPTYTAEGDKGQTDERTEQRHHSSTEKDLQLEQYQQKEKSEMVNQHDEAAFGAASNGVKMAHLDETLSPQSLVPSASSSHSQAEASQEKVPWVPSTSEFISDQFSRHNAATLSNCDEKMVEVDNDSIVKTMVTSFLTSPEKAPKNKSPNEAEPQEKVTVQQNEEIMEPVKLRIKLDRNNVETSNGIEERSSNGNGKVEKSDGREKEQRKRLKAEKKEKKRLAKLEKERKKKAHKECQFYEQQQPISSSAHLQNGERSLKLSLRRLACWRGTSSSATPEYCSNLSYDGIRISGAPVDLPNGGTATKGDDAQIKTESAHDSLKLRIPKLILHKNEETVCGETKAVEHRKKGRKRKSHEEKLHPREQRVEDEESPMKVPRLKLRIKNVCSDEKKRTTNTQLNAVSRQNSSPELEMPREGRDKQIREMEHRQAKPPSPTNIFHNIDNSRIQFSPCCSEESGDDELRIRTNELFSKLCQD